MWRSWGQQRKPSYRAAQYPFSLLQSRSPTKMLYARRTLFLQSVQNLRTSLQKEATNKNQSLSQLFKKCVEVTRSQSLTGVCAGTSPESPAERCCQSKPLHHDTPVTSVPTHPSSCPCRTVATVKQPTDMVTCISTRVRNVLFH